MKGLYKNIDNQLAFAENEIRYPDGTVIQVSEHTDKPEETEVHDGWFVFYSRENALTHFNIEENEAYTNKTIH